MSTVNFNSIAFDVLNQLGVAAVETAQLKGFNTAEEGAEIDQKLLLIVSEVCEAQDELRSGRSVGDVRFAEDGKPEGFGIELADAIIRIVQLAASQGVNLARAVEIKMAYNLTRPFKHGRTF